MGALPHGLASRPALLLHKLGNRLLARAEGPLAAIGLSGRQYVVLAVMDSDEPASQLELANLCGLLPAQVVPVLDELERSLSDLVFGQLEPAARAELGDTLRLALARVQHAE